MNTAIYLRAARNDHGQLDTQTQRLHAYAAEHDMAVTATFFDVGPGTDRDRPGLSALLDAARAGRFDRLLVHRLDRLARTAYDLAGVLDDLDHAGITLHCAAEPSGINMLTRDALAVIRLLSAATVDDAAPDAHGAGHATPPVQRTSRERRR
jgi:DNA invertase Pin-like site-specific DNA recombinase